ncbi:MAG: relaxase/mobilization nuclease domain-containing protein [Thermodesulfobacteriota bacterium]
MDNSTNEKIDDHEPKALRGRKGARTSFQARLNQPDYIAAAHSKKTEAIVKVASYAQGFMAKRLLLYVSRANQLGQEIEVEDQDGCSLVGKEEIEKLYAEWKKDFDHRKRGPIPEGVKTKGGKKQYERRHATHLILSADAAPTNANNNKVLAAAREVIRKHIGERGYDYILALHPDSNKAHVHIVIKNAHREKGGPKLRLNPPELHEMRTNFAAQLTELKLEHIATLRRDRPHIMDRVRYGIESLYAREKQFQRGMIRETPSRDAFAYRRAVSRSLVRLREQVKKETLPLTEQRRELLGAIRKVERELTKARPEIGKEIAATVRKFGRDAQNYKTWLAELTAPKRAQGLPRKQEERRVRTLEAMQKKTALEIKEARQEIEAAPIGREERKAALGALAIHEKAIKGRSPVEVQVQKIVEGFGKAVEKYERQVAGNRHPVTNEPPRTQYDKLVHRAKLEKVGEKLEKQLGQVSKVIEKTVGLDLTQQRAAVRQLRQWQRTVQQTREKSLGLGLGR